MIYNTDNITKHRKKVKRSSVKNRKSCANIGHLISDIDKSGKTGYNGKWYAIQGGLPMHKKSASSEENL